MCGLAHLWLCTTTTPQGGIWMKLVYRKVISAIWWHHMLPYNKIGTKFTQWMLYILYWPLQSWSIWTIPWKSPQTTLCVIKHAVLTLAVLFCSTLQIPENHHGSHYFLHVFSSYIFHIFLIMSHTYICPLLQWQSSHAGTKLVRMYENNKNDSTLKNYSHTRHCKFTIIVKVKKVSFGKLPSG